jgi:hypothetical protein
MGLAFGFGLIAFLGLIAFVRLAPSDPAVWHADLAANGFQPPGKAHVFCIRPDNRYGPIPGDPAEMLARLDALALATARTERLAGSVEDGRITWITRSALIGYPDFTTAQVLEGPALCIMGQQRFGSSDFGVNASRIGGWMQELLGLPEKPPMTGF